ncbi:WD repeat-containing protein 26-like [Heracleum sosnowskyi]|uniref:WD repeat-containing protein 26-like n=1 Tax=Heracleum sosnowskyi TaxID=360622 RepID=A0AAD8LWP2_9APIA|nr:WD repeat-containing protein 26-like [Heracleum sosnowskyi]
MGGVEDDQPPSKRVKVTSKHLGGFANGYSPRESASCSLSLMMARPLSSQGDDEIIGTKGIVKKVELLFMQQILDGNWDKSLHTLHKFSQLDETTIKSASFTILEQKFLELLDEEKLMDALKTLRTEIAPLCINSNRIHNLSTCIVSPSQRDQTGSAAKTAVKAKSRSTLLEELQRIFPPTVIIPERRLVHLVEQALDLQRDACIFHNSLVGDMSLYTDHQCGRDQIPSQTLQILQEHSDEVWFLQFSHNGQYLASASGDHLVIIWEVNSDGRVTLKNRLSGHQKPIFHVSWSPDGLQLLTCGVQETARRWNVYSGECLQVYEKNGVGIVSCEWAPDGKGIYFGFTDKSISVWDLEGKEVECWKGQRIVSISDLGVTSDGKRIITICKNSVILLFDKESNVEKFVEEDETITSFSLSSDNKFLLVSLVNQEIHLWKIEGHPKLVGKYRGHKRTRYVLKACFGGFEQSFVACGSEDAQVYIWHRGSGKLVETLPGHSGAVNSVSWNPANPHMLASASDDGTIRIWGLNPVKMRTRGPDSNGVHYSNGGTPGEKARVLE